VFYIDRARSENQPQTKDESMQQSTVTEKESSNQQRELHRQGKNLERTTNKRSINVTVNGDSQREQEAASMRTTKVSKAGERRPTI
jgi:hypothetical protein